MTNPKLLAVLVLLQVITLHIHGVASSTANKRVPKPSGGRCHISGFLYGKAGKCNKENGSDCCIPRHRYPQFKCSHPVSAKTPAILTLNRFAAGGDGGGKSFCDNCFHKDSELVVALSTGWLRLDGTRRGNKMIRINGNGQSAGQGRRRVRLGERGRWRGGDGPPCRAPLLRRGLQSLASGAGQPRQPALQLIRLPWPWIHSRVNHHHSLIY